MKTQHILTTLVASIALSSIGYAATVGSPQSIPLSYEHNGSPTGSTFTVDPALRAGSLTNSTSSQTVGVATLTIPGAASNTTCSIEVTMKNHAGASISPAALTSPTTNDKIPYSVSVTGTKSVAGSTTASVITGTIDQTLPFSVQAAPNSATPSPECKINFTDISVKITNNYAATMGTYTGSLELVSRYDAVAAN